MSTIPSPAPVVIVTAQNPDLRAQAIASLRSLVRAGTLQVLSGTEDTLSVELEAATGTDCIVIDLETIETVDDVLDVLESFIDDGRFTLLGILTQLDVLTFWAEFTGGESEDVRGLITQIESASLLVLAEAGPVENDVRLRVEGFVRNLNPATVVISADALRVQTLASLAELIAAAENDDTVEDDPDVESIAGETDAWGYNSFTWTTESALDREAFLELFEEWPNAILRAHGVVRMDDGGIVMVSAVRNLVTLDEYDELDEDDLIELGAEESELAFVGIDLPVSELVARLDACRIENA